MNPLLKVENLHVHFDSYAGAVHAVRGVSFTVEKGEVLAEYDAADEETLLLTVPDENG